MSTSGGAGMPGDNKGDNCSTEHSKNKGVILTMNKLSNAPDKLNGVHPYLQMQTRLELRS